LDNKPTYVVFEEHGSSEHL